MNDNGERYLGPNGRTLFREEILRLEDGRTLGAALEDWQREHVFGPIDAIDENGHPRYRLLDFELPRGHGKTTGIAAVVVTELILGGHDLRAFAFASDEDQAGLLHDAAAGFIARLPKELRQKFTIERRRIEFRPTRSELRVMSADAPSAYGLVADLIVVDELGQFHDRELWDSLITALPKKPNARLIVISTPGWRRKSIAWEVREAARTTDGYYLFAPGKPLASFVDRAEVERQRATLPRHVFARLHLGQWSDGEGSLVTAEDLARCIRPDRSPRLSCSEPSFHVIACDLGLRNDRAVVAVVHRTMLGVALDTMRTWEGSHEAPVRIIDDVEPFIVQCLRTFPFAQITLDPWQMESTFERLQRIGVHVELFNFTGTAIDRLTTNLYSIAHGGQLELYPDLALEEELLDVQVVEKSYGVRIDHRADAHDDRVIALGMGAYVAMQLPAGEVIFDDGFDERTRSLLEHEPDPQRRLAIEMRAIREELGGGIGPDI